MIQKMSDM